MSAQHTPGPIRYDYAPGYCGELIAFNDCTLATFVDEPSPEDASRLVACWNACEGISTESLEENLPVKELTTNYNAAIQALRTIAAITTRADQDPEAMCAEIQGVCRVALAKVTGGAA